jgi:hypothetical protein
MTRECMDCHAHMGEKCPHCGTENIAFRWNTKLENAVAIFKVFTCLNSLCPGRKRTDEILAPTFREGEGPNGTQGVLTTGICPKCLARRMKELHAAPGMFA